MNPILVRFARASDLEAICRVEDDSFSRPYPHKLIAKLLRDHTQTFFVAEFPPGTIVGYCVAAEKGSSAHLISIGVISEYRRQGFATALIERLIASLNPKTRELRLEVRQDNTEAIMLYQELGFKNVELIESYYEDGSTAVKMLLTLEDAHALSRNNAE